SGARVAALDRSAPSDLPGGARGFGADVTDEASIAEAFVAVASEMGTPWGLIHTVGMWDGGPLAETELSVWRQVMDLNLTSAFLCVREAVRRMDAGRIVAIASRQGADRAPEQQAAYAASKAGVVRLVEATAAEHGSISTVAVAPSMILFGGEEPGTAGVTAEAVADLCVRLCGDAGPVHTGATLRAYGDG
ncbi:MAG: SDR family oxidoreductase, partial [Bacteroidota bacterium]